MHDQVRKVRRGFDKAQQTITAMRELQKRVPFNFGISTTIFSMNLDDADNILNCTAFSVGEGPPTGAAGTGAPVPGRSGAGSPGFAAPSGDPAGDVGGAAGDGPPAEPGTAVAAPGAVVAPGAARPGRV